MKINKGLIKEKFNEYNKLYFNSELPKCEIRIKSAYRYYGLFKCKFDEKYKKVTCKSITISDLYDYTEETLANILIHEMIHYYLAYKHIDNELSHGDAFKKMANEMNEKYNMKISEKVDCSKFKKTKNAPSFSWFLVQIFC